MSPRGSHRMGEAVACAFCGHVPWFAKVHTGPKGRIITCSRRKCQRMGKAAAGIT